MPLPLVFSKELTGHTADVRALATHRTPDGTLLLLSGSRDQTARLWIRGADGTYRSVVIDNGNGFVNAVAFFEDFDGKRTLHTHTVYALTGGQDALVNAYLVSISTQGDVKLSSTPRFTLVGHADNVSTLAVLNSKYIVSGSWDATVRVWKNWECVATFTRHTLAVWSVLPIDADRFLSASADKSVYLWSLSAPNEPLASFTGASQPVRGLARVSDTSFASCGNDGAIRLYPIQTGTALPSATLKGHTSFVYAVSSLAPDLLVSSGEDHCLNVWHNGSLAQVLTLPAISVWCACALPNGDVACGTSDAQVRIFTPDAAQTSTEQINVFEATVASQVLAAAELEANTPRGERSLLDTPGRAEGETCIVYEESATEVYRWSSYAQVWKKIGLVTDSAGSGQKKMLNGKAYDYIFDVDVEDGAPPLKLPYNANENPYEAASRFLNTYQLPASYLDQVVKFLEKNTQAVGLTTPQASDPYTGAASYTPSATNVASADPFTGSDGITSAAPQLQQLPHKQFLAFQQANVPAARAKINELAGEDAPLTEEQGKQLDALVDALQAQAPADIQVLTALLGIWPLSKRFPLLDLLRVAAAQRSRAPFSTFATEALVGADWDTLTTQTDRKAAETNGMLALRTLANGFAAPGGAEALTGMALEVRIFAHLDPRYAAATAVECLEQAWSHCTCNHCTQFLGAGTAYSV